MRYKIVREYVAVVTEQYIVDDEDFDVNPKALARAGADEEEGEDMGLILDALLGEDADYQDITFDCEESLEVTPL